MSISKPEKIQTRQPSASEIEAAAARTKEILDKIDLDNQVNATARRDLLVSLGIKSPELELILDCRCDCHPTVVLANKHQGGTCHCQFTPEQKEASKKAALDALQSLWSKSEEELASDRLKEQEIAAFARGQNLQLSYMGGGAPFEIRGIFQGRAFYFRERHERYSLELSNTNTPLTNPYDDAEPGLLCAQGVSNELYKNEWNELEILKSVCSMLQDVLRIEICQHESAKPEDTFCSFCGFKLLGN